jgi:hypothetical protein
MGTPRPHRFQTLARWALLTLVCLTGCADAEKEQLMTTIQPAYDQRTGKLVRITYDANQDGRVDTWTEMDGAQPLASRIDRDQDGKVDRWEYYSPDGTLAKVGFSRADDGKPDAWAFAGADGRVERVESSSRGDEKRIDRWEYYAASPLHPDGAGALVRAEEDTNEDGKPDKWETYAGDALETVAFDENGDGVPDTWLRY